MPVTKLPVGDPIRIGLPIERGPGRSGSTPAARRRAPASRRALLRRRLRRKKRLGRGPTTNDPLNSIFDRYRREASL